MEYTLPNAVVREQDLRGKNAIVTGATRGIGRGIAFHLAARGANILGTCSSEGSLKLIASLQEEIKALYQEKNPGNHPAPKIFGVVASLTEPQECCSVVVDAVKDHLSGDVNILVQNAAVAEIQPIETIDEGHVHRSLTGNIETPIFLIKALLPHFRPESRIVNISSEGARLSAPGGLVYSACKAALEAMTRVWAEELGKRKGMERTTVNALSVGLTRTDLVKNLSEDDPITKVMVSRTQLVCVEERFGEPDDIAEIAGWLCTEKARWVTGSVMNANGGVTKIL
ncbi:3-oxoacyl-acyl-carrier-protein reductase [Diaporthe amygdali]|uniref:3-oxoacyl-acyl-carrier-protein reductase n=1 Tax=Phomopsis amygdali TaxID=1214568 RepID=UPI0022FF3691|nr:3-oxoacyl-acyl-carrier-protein reductase [Diaporthe amygdali]KAJ0115228.1 3-oxoacyl-acyl-carrier-protein reductase [Diaporthe amygdali]